MSAGGQDVEIALRGVHKRYETGVLSVHALRGIDLSIPRGDFVAIMGPSGSGKSTLLEIMGCLSKPSEGSYQLRGVPVQERDANELARLRGREIGFVFQSFHLLPRLNLLDNVELPLLYRRLPRRERRERSAHALERVGLAHRARHRPAEVSGGERQRAAIARALVGEPSVLLADEPTGNLDSERGREILDILEGIHREGSTVVIVTHEAAFGQLARRRVVLRDGLIESDENGAAA